ncbi:hypothetical protein NEOLI_000227 [Neolecta irregularis DAH-3]|uniref:DNA/RNA-binding protein Alba-like domain-containing protein n=1 Tax=Neolecta irregularis (strain DAH-3) TaxID=1198029 RepID=A0A1U7LK73_NEOID|nr:hypothetical protein NEOLI_000227 [Neolecta irregularis DAH-3]|eukprot:OLL22921.1 hypothetical protein NEOLI_000227 [Neolecta irregularis DAH-3]
MPQDVVVDAQGAKRKITEESDEVDIALSCNITKAVNRGLETLGKHHSVSFKGTGAAAGKAITISEIIKRRLDESGKIWWQKTNLASLEIVKKAKSNPTGHQDTEDDFEPVQPSLLKQETKHIKPIITIIITLNKPHDLESSYYQTAETES